MSKPVAAILGASTNREKFGNKAVRAHVDQGFEVYPVNPRATEVEGLKCYASIADVPGPIDRVSIYLPPAIVIDELDAIASRNPKEVWLNPGAESEAVIAKATELGLNVVVACSIVNLGTSPSEYSD